MTTYVSLFSGAGGWDLGCDAAGWECVAQVEWDPWCQQVLERHWPNVPRWSDVTDVDGAELPPAEVVCFGSPCTDLSVAGQRAGLDGDASGLFHEVRRHPRTSGTAGPIVAALTRNGVGGGGGPDDNAAQAGHLVVANTLTARDAKGPPTRLDAGQGNVVVGLAENQRGEVLLTEHMHQITAGGGKPGQGYPAVLAFHATQEPITGDVSPALPTDNGSIGVAIPLDLRNATRSSGTGAGTQGEVIGEPGDPAGTITGHSLARPAVATDLMVRRLTPRECERLMGWPDDHTRWTADGREIARAALGPRRPRPAHIERNFATKGTP